MKDEAQKGLVSVVIPCYNAGRWLRESIDSCLNQTYRPVEIIVVDDGSTDDSLQIVKSYGSRIQFVTGPNRGGNHARNKGFALSRGEYIQYLDADDYLLQEKIERQVNALEETKADVVYGDWRVQRHLPNGLSYLMDIMISGQQQDVLKSLLAAWWVAPCVLLFRRTSVQNSGGWDESLKVAQDKDFFISVAMSGSRIVYQPGCFSVYRNYGPVTVSTSNRSQWLQYHCSVLQKAEKNLAKAGRLTTEYKKALALGYFFFARRYHRSDAAMYSQLLKRVLELDPEFRPIKETLAYRAIQRICGYDLTERLYTKKVFARSALTRMPLFSIFQDVVGRSRYYYHMHLKSRVGAN